MFLSELFKLHNVEYPDWLTHEFVEDDLINAYYTFEDGVHKWELHNPIKHIIICFEGNTLRRIGYNHNNEKISEYTATKDTKIIV